VKVVPTLDKNDQELCSRCKKNGTQGPHSCPYQEDINDNPATDYCDCCYACLRACCEDI
jgi:hypothetical protein